jgi:hypothetical protein
MLSAFRRDQQQHQHQEEGDASSSSTSASLASPPPPPDESEGDECKRIKRITAQKARAEQGAVDRATSVEHAKREFPKRPPVYVDSYFKVMVAGEAGHGKTT